MPFTPGHSGNPKGRPKQTDEQKAQHEEFLELLTKATVPALKGIIEIAADRHNKDRFNASRYLIEKAYGSTTGLLFDKEIDELNIKIITCDPRKMKAADTDEDWF